MLVNLRTSNPFPKPGDRRAPPGLLGRLSLRLSSVDIRRARRFRNLAANQAESPRKRRFLPFPPAARGFWFFASNNQLETSSFSPSARATSKSCNNLAFLLNYFRPIRSLP